MRNDSPRGLLFQVSARFLIIFKIMNQNQNQIKKQTWTLKQVQQESTEHRPLVVHAGIVHDLTEFLDSHPGGRQLLLQHQGQDVTELLLDPQVHRHSPAALLLLSDYAVGVLIPEDHDEGSISMRPIHASLSTESLPDSSNHDAVLQPSFLSISSSLKSPSAFDSTSNSCINKNWNIRLDQPIMYQLWTAPIDRTTYLQQIHRPRHMKDSARFFAHPLLEPFSRTPWWCIPLLWLPVSYWLFQSAYQALSFTTVCSLFTAGLCTWSLVEYCLHRFLFHLDDQLPDTKLAFMLHFLFHGVHHFLPMDRYVINVFICVLIAKNNCIRMRLVFPPALAVCLICIIWPLFSLLFSFHQECAFLSGGAIGYIIYDLTHYYIHHGQPFGPFRRLKRVHMAHHYQNHRQGYGITSDFWDVIFGTDGE